MNRCRGNTRMRRATWFVVCLALIFLAIWGCLEVVNHVTAPNLTGDWLITRDVLMVLSLMGLSILSYVAWPSRWNVLAHAQVAFGIVAFVLPILVLRVQDNFPPTVVNFYFSIIFLGFFCSFIGAGIGAWLSSIRWSSRPQPSKNVSSEVHGSLQFADLDDERRKVVTRRVEIAVLSSVAGLAVCFLAMGFVPALAENPFAAKFFKGAYAEPYARVAPLYRLVTTFLALLTPIVTVYAWVRRDIKWVIFLCLSLVGLLLTLQRGPALTGILLFVGILFAASRRSMFPYFLALLGVYVAGSGFYYLLGVLGIGEYASLVNGGDSLIQNIAAGAPDVVDQLTFLQLWQGDPEYTYGKTFVGGLVPGNFEWNPAVWGLHITNPGTVVSAINSGGYRLPGPIWGMVSFAWPGVVAVSFFSGLLIGVITGVAKRRLAASSLEASVLRFVFYGAVLACANFYVLGYMDVISLLLMWYLFRSQGQAHKLDKGFIDWQGRDFQSRRLLRS